MFKLLLGLMFQVRVYAGHGDAGIYWQSPKPDICLIIEVRGEPGIAGNGVLGLTGSDCS